MDLALSAHTIDRAAARASIEIVLRSRQLAAEQTDN
jgi:hypothetical protein